MNTLNGYSKSTLTDFYVLTASGGHYPLIEALDALLSEINSVSSKKEFPHLISELIDCDVISSNDLYSDNFITNYITSNTINTYLVNSTGILTLNSNAGIYLKYTNDDTKSIVLNGSEFKPFDTANGLIDLGASDARWKTVYGLFGDFLDINVQGNLLSEILDILQSEINSLNSKITYKLLVLEQLDTNVVSSNNVYTDTITVAGLITSTVTGVAPLVVSSTTLVSNLNADLLDGVQYLKSFTNASEIDSSSIFWAANGSCSDVSSMGYAAVLSVIGNSARRWQIWNSRNDHLLYWRPELADMSGYADVHVLLDNYNYKNYVDDLYWANLPLQQTSSATTSPTFANTTMSGVLTFTTASNAATIKFLNGEIIDGYGNVKLGSNSASWNAFLNDGTRVLTVYSSGNVGIGTGSSALAKLHIVHTSSGSVSSNNALYITDNTTAVSTRFMNIFAPSLTASTATTSGAHIVFGINGDAYNFGYMKFVYAGLGSTSNAIRFGLADADNLVSILANGNVGIGTTSPSHKLHVAGAGVFSNTGSTTYTTNGITIGAGDVSYRYITCYGKTSTSYLNLGYNAATNNCAELGFTYSSSESTSNYASLGLFGGANRLLIYPGVTLSTKYIHAPSYTSNDGRFNYGLAYYNSTASTVTGTIVITLPNAFTSSMNTYEIDIYEYIGYSEASDNVLHSKLIIDGYNYSSSSAWINYGYQQIGSYNKGVRLGYNGSKCCILLGTTSTTWTYPQVHLSRVITGYNNLTTWSTGYSISVITDESSYSAIVTASRTRQVFADVVGNTFRGGAYKFSSTSTTYGSTSIELYGPTPFIDFHYNSSTADYTSRIIEGLSGQLTVYGKLRIGLGYTTSTTYTFYVNGSAYASSLTVPLGSLTVGSDGGDTTTYRVIKSYDTTNLTKYINIGYDPSAGNAGEFHYTYSASASTSNHVGLGFYSGNRLKLYYNGGSGVGKAVIASAGSSGTEYELLHTGNYSTTLDGRYYTETEADSRFVNVTGDTMTGSLTFANNTWNVVGDDAAIGDYNAAGMLGLKSCNNDIPGIGFHNKSNTLLGRLQANGSNLYWNDYILINSGNWPSYIGGLGYVMRGYTIDASSLDVDTWYPVTFSIGAAATTRIECRVALNSGTVPSWSTHTNGFSVRKIWEVNGSGWGTNPVNRRIFESDSAFTSTDPVRGLSLLTNSSTEYVYIRGGGKYHFYTSHNVTPVLRTATYTINSLSVAPTTTTPSVITATAFSNSVYAPHFYESSDIRYKTIINNLAITANQLANLPLFDFKWQDNEDLLNTGTSAQAVQEILPHIVSGEDKLTLDYGVLGTIAGITACKELTELEKEIKKLKKRVKELEDKLILFNL